MVERSITIAGESYDLKYPNKAVRRIDRELGYPAMQMIEKVERHGYMAALSLDDIATVIWGGMLHNKPGQTIDQVAELIPLRLDEMIPVVEALLEIIMEIYGVDGTAEGTPEEEESEGNAVGDRGTGTGNK